MKRLNWAHVPGVRYSSKPWAKVPGVEYPDQRRPRRKLLPPNEQAQARILAMGPKQMTVEQIAEEVRCHPDWVRKVFRRHEVNRDHMVTPRYPEAFRERAIEVSKKLGVTEAARRLGCDKNSISRWRVAKRRDQDKEGRSV